MSDTTLNDISARFEGLFVEETRALTDSYVELVFLNKDMAAWSTVLQDCFGSPAKEAASRPSRDDRALSKAHGGINKGQTLYQRGEQDGRIVAMLWPWQNSTHITLKIFTVEEDGRDR